VVLVVDEEVGLYSASQASCVSQV